MTRAKEATGRASAGAALAIALLALSGGAPARAYDDASTVTSMLSLFGAGEEENEKIVYRERSKLVLPPGGRQLPEPQSRESARPAAWPVDQEMARRRGAQRPAPQAGLNENPNEPGAKRGPTKCLAAATEGNCTLATEADDPLLGAGDGPRTRAAGQSSTRAFLTEPPAAYRQKVGGGKGVADAEKSSDWWNPGALIGRVFGD
ncbi:hypothetical protein [Methylosinus sp. Sm6]|uniref:hypothetical protein n=1 Tax=Methylosinus sp. Sm6 TaxID=2866948 RepID=UPI001C991027|nr:hypothetical protein [Methylosinus sp. Sm6]MBY6243567.1 hypothetical protein [Methylosinus sp. Sm6]